MTCLLMQPADAQCGSGPRYVDSIFAGYTLDSVTYSTVYNQKMDIYQPLGDASTGRPLVILAHGGSFVSGTRSDDLTVTTLCADLAHKGYVTASIDYRLTAALNLLTADSAISAVLEAVHDGKAAVRYFYKDVLTNGNTYKIDTNNIFIGGTSAGGVLFMHYAYVDSISQLNANFQAVLNNLGGGLDGLSGNAGYSSNFKGVINLAGGLNDPTWIGHCSKPVVSAQGTLDSVVPYYCANAEYGVVPVALCGLGSLQPYIAANTQYWSSLTFPGAGHTPWESNTTDLHMVDTLITGFLNKAICTSMSVPCPVNGIQEVQYTANISLYPNPANNVLNIQSSEFINDVALADQTGRTVAHASDINTLNYQMNTSPLSSGVYFLRVNDNKGHIPIIKKVVIE
jgi:hypothetical protein